MTDSDKTTCFHCGLPVPSGIDLSVTIRGEARPMCCHGCKAVAEAIVDNGLEGFYENRTQTQQQGEQLIPESLRLYDDERIQESFVHLEADGLKEASLMLEGIVCAACIWLNEKHVQSLPGVRHFTVNYTTHRARLVWDPAAIPLSEIIAAIAAIGYHAHPYDPRLQEGLLRAEQKTAVKRLALAAVGAMQVMMLSLGIYLDMDMALRHQQLLHWASFVITLPVLLYSGRPFFLGAWRDLRRGSAGMDVPVALALSIAFVASTLHTWQKSGDVYFDSVNMFIFFLLSSRFFEMRVRHRALRQMETLSRILPTIVLRLREDGSTEQIALTDLQVNERVLVKTGQVIPADGVIEDNATEVDESLLTGESRPVPKSPGESVIGGSINRGHPVTIAIQHTGQDTRLASLLRLLERAQEDKPRIARFADRIAGKFITALLVVVAAAALVWWQVDIDRVLPVSLAILVVTCPCALSLATPAAIGAASGAFLNNGLLLAHGDAIERLSAVDEVIFDKTGTLTWGKPRLAQIQAFPSTDPAADEDRVLAIAAALEAKSEHPLAHAFVEAAALRNTSPLQAEAVQVHAGMGIEGLVDGINYRLGNPAFVQKLAGELPDVDFKNKGTQLWLASGNAVIAAFMLQDQLREAALPTIQSLHEQGMAITILSGDETSVVDSIATQLNIEQAHAKQLPEDKLAYVDKQQAKGQCVAMVGDGVNDAPVLAKADVAIAMGEGADLARISADIVLLGGDIRGVAQALSMARKTRRIIHQNFAWAIGYNLVALPIAFAGWVAPWMAAIGMSLSSLLVVLNATRLRNGSGKSPKSKPINNI